MNMDGQDEQDVNTLFILSILSIHVEKNFSGFE